MLTFLLKTVKWLIRPTSLSAPVNNFLQSLEELRFPRGQLPLFFKTGCLLNLRLHEIKPKSIIVSLL